MGNQVIRAGIVRLVEIKFFLLMVIRNKTAISTSKIIRTKPFVLAETNRGYKELQQQPVVAWLCKEIKRANQDGTVQERGIILFIAMTNIARVF